MFATLHTEPLPQFSRVRAGGRDGYSAINSVSERDLAPAIPQLFAILLSCTLVDAVEVLSSIFRFEDAVLGLKLVRVSTTSKDSHKNTHRRSTAGSVLLRYPNSTTVARLEFDGLTAFFLLISHVFTCSRSSLIHTTPNRALFRIIILLLPGALWRYRSARR